MLSVIKPQYCLMSQGNCKLIKMSYILECRIPLKEMDNAILVHLIQQKEGQKQNGAILTQKTLMGKTKQELMDILQRDTAWVCLKERGSETFKKKLEAEIQALEQMAAVSAKSEHQEEEVDNGWGNESTINPQEVVDTINHNLNIITETLKNQEKAIMQLEKGVSEIHKLLQKEKDKKQEEKLQQQTRLYEVSAIVVLVVLVMVSTVIMRLNFHYGESGEV